MRVGRQFAELAQNGGGFAEFRFGQANVADEAMRGLGVLSITDVAATVTSC
jgi:hypothetical protein